MITSNFVDDACSEVNSFTDDRMMKEFDAFFKEQPSICDFITELTSESAMKLQELALFMSYIVCKAVKKGMPEGVPPVSPESIEAAFRESEGWIERINEGAEVADMPVDTEPYLIQYVISELNQPLEDGTLLEDEQKGEVFFVLKTVISSLTRSSLGKKPKDQNEKPSSTAKTINVLLVVGALLLTSGIMWYALRTPAPDTRAALPKPATTTLDPEQFSGKVRTAYEAAKEVPEVLAQLPCFCGCMSGFGHRNNLDCFHDNHGVECTMCQDIAINARGMYKSGFDIKDIRDKIKEKYGKYAAVTHEH